MLAIRNSLAQLNDETDSDRPEGRKEVGLTGPRLGDFPAHKLRPCRAAALEAAAAVAGKHGGFISGDNFVGRAVHARLPGVNPDNAVAKTANLVELMTDEHDRAPSARHIPHFAQTFF